MVLGYGNTDLFGERSEKPEYLDSQIITYIGNKRALLNPIGDAIAEVKKELKKESLVLFDVFSGSGIVARYFKRFASRIYANDLEAYSCLLNECFLTNASSLDLRELECTQRQLEENISTYWHPGFITEMYAPKDENNIQPGERVFYTPRNARYIDTARSEIAKLSPELQKFFLATLLVGASVHVNTSGVFKGFYKNTDGIGQYGGTGRNALTRILGDIHVEVPVLSDFDCESIVMQKDARRAALEMPEEVDLAYLDPPYNQHPYGSNYFMLNLILDYKRPEEYSKVSGIPCGWNHSPYNQRKEAQRELFEVVKSIRAKYILISYNSEGFVTYDDFITFLSSLGQVSVVSTDYNTFRGCRNLNDRELHVKEYLFLLKK